MKHLASLVFRVRCAGFSSLELADSHPSLTLRILSSRTSHMHFDSILIAHRLRSGLAQRILNKVQTAFTSCQCGPIAPPYGVRNPLHYRDGVSSVESVISHFTSGEGTVGQGVPPDDRNADHGPDDPRDGLSDASKHASHDALPIDARWPSDAPSAAVGQVVLAVNAAITLKRRAAAASLTVHGDAVPLLPVTPTRQELAVVIALADTYGAALSSAPRFVPVLDFIADYGAVKLVQRVMYGARPTTDFDVTAYAAENARLAELLREARTAFEFLCATWPEAFMAQASEALGQLGLPRLHAPAPPPTNCQRGGRVGLDDGPGDEFDEEGGDA